MIVLGAWGLGPGVWGIPSQVQIDSPTQVLTVNLQSGGSGEMDTGDGHEKA